MQAEHKIEVGLSDEDEERTKFQAKKLSVNPDIIREFKREAVKLQTQFYHTYQDKIRWNGDPKLETVNLKQILAQILYGYPKIEGASDIRSAGYKRRHCRTVDMLVRRIQNHFRQTTCNISSVLILMRSSKSVDSQQMFRIWNDEKQIFLDSTCRVYKDWDSFLNENIFLTSVMCCPIGGIYRMGHTDVLVEYPFNPSSKPIFYVLDIVSLIFSVIAIILFIVAAVMGDTAIWIAGAIVAVLFLPYRVFRAGYTIRDGWKHQ